MLISPAYAQAAAGPGGGALFAQLLPFLLIFAVLYFFMIRPQQKKMKQHREMLANLRRGDRIVTGGGIIGRVVRVEDGDEMLVEIAPDVKVRVKRSTVSDVLAKGEPASGGGEKKSGSGKKKNARKRSDDSASRDKASEDKADSEDKTDG